MTRIIRIEKCAECPYRDVIFRTSGLLDVCTALPKEVIEDASTVPDWCPLERAQEPKGASEDE